MSLFGGPRRIIASRSEQPAPPANLVYRLCAVPTATSLGCKPASGTVAKSLCRTLRFAPAPHGPVWRCGFTPLQRVCRATGYNFYTPGVLTPYNPGGPDPARAMSRQGRVMGGYNKWGQARLNGGEGQLRPFARCHVMTWNDGHPHSCINANGKPRPGQIAPSYFPIQDRARYTFWAGPVLTENKSRFLPVATQTLLNN